MKTCTKCLRSLPTTDFHKHPISADGLKPRCKRCQCEAERLRRFKPASRSVQMWHDLNKRVRLQPEYAGVKVLITRASFVAWATPLLTVWFSEHPDLTPSVDRIDPAGHYRRGNIRIIELGENSRLRRANHNVHAPAGKAWCCTCKAYKSRSEFQKNRSKPHGLQHNCRGCRQAIRLRASTSRQKTGEVRSSSASPP